MSDEWFGENKRTYDASRPQYRLGESLLDQIPHTGQALDLGSGLGEFSDFLVKRGYRVFGVEGVSAFVTAQRERGLDVQQVNLEEDALPFEDDAFDLIVSLDVIEHLWQIDHYLEEINRCLKPSGHLIVSTVNYNYWKFRITHLLGRMERFTFGSRHKKFYTFTSLNQELESRFNIKGAAFSFPSHPEWQRSMLAVWPNLWAEQVALLCESKKS